MRILFLGNSDILNRKILPSLHKSKNFKCELASRKKIKNNFFVKSYKNYDYAIKKTKSKLVYISLINSLHFKYCRKALNSNKHVIVDKPLSLNYKKNNELLNLAKKKRLLLAEAIVFTFNKRFKEFYSSINFKKKLNIEIFFSIPSLNKDNFRNYKSQGGGCYNDMSSYAFKCLDLFYKDNLNKFSFTKKLKNKIINSFEVKIFEKNFNFKSSFKFNSNYKNFIKVKNDKKILYLPMAFSQPLNNKLYYKMNNTKKYFKFENSFHTFLINIKDTIRLNKNFDKFYNEINRLTKIRKLFEQKT